MGSETVKERASNRQRRAYQSHLQSCHRCFVVVRMSVRRIRPRMVAAAAAVAAVEFAAGEAAAAAAEEVAADVERLGHPLDAVGHRSMFERCLLLDAAGRCLCRSWGFEGQKH